MTVLFITLSKIAFGYQIARFAFSSEVSSEQSATDLTSGLATSGVDVVTRKELVSSARPAKAAGYDLIISLFCMDGEVEYCG